MKFASKVLSLLLALPAALLASASNPPFSVNAPTNNQVLAYNSATGFFQNISIGSMGAGVVTNVIGVAANGVSWSILNSTSTPTITISLGAITPTTVWGLTITPTVGGTLTIANGKRLTSSSTITFADASDGTTQTFQGTGTVVNRDSTDTLTNKTYDTVGTGNAFKINGSQVSDLTGGSLAIATGHLTLSGDSTAPGNSYFYGTNASGVKGWYLQSSEGVVDSVSGTANQIVASSPTGNVTLSLPNALIIPGTIQGNTISTGTGTLSLGSATVAFAGNFATSGAFSTTLTATANTALTLPTTGTLSTLAGTETLLNKTLTAPTIVGGTATELTGLGVQSSGVNDFDLLFANSETLTADRTLTLTLNDANRTINLGGNLTLAGAFITSGAFSTTLTETANTSVTLPTSGTLVGSADVGTVTNAMLAGSIANNKLSNSTITVAGNSTALGGSVTQDAITGLSSTGIVKRTGANALSIATSGTDYAPATSGSSILSANGSGGFSNATATQAFTLLGSNGGTNSLLYTSAANALASLSAVNSAMLTTTSGGAPQYSTTLPTGLMPALTGDVTNSAGSLATTVGKIGGNAVSLGGAFTMSGGFTFTGTITGNTSVTFPTSGTLATTSGTVSAVSIATANGFSGSSSGGTTPALTIVAGAITPASVNGLTLSALATGFSVAGGTTSKTLTVSNTMTLAGGADGQTYTFPATSATIARTDAANTFTGASSTTSWNLTTPVITGGLTASGSGSNDFSGSTGTFKTSTGANTLSGSVTVADATTPSVTTASGKTNTGFYQVNGKTSGALKITSVDAAAQTVTLSLAAQTSGAATLTIPDMAGTNKTVAWLESPSFTTPNIGAATASSVTDSGLTSGRVTFASTAGLLADSSSLTYNSGTGALSATSFIGSGTSLTGIPYTISGTTGQITASAGTGNITLSIPSAVTGVNSITSVSGQAEILATGTSGTALTIASATNIPTWSQGAMNFTGATTITGGAGNMTITSGTGNSRTLALQSTTSGGIATTFLTGNADQSATFANTVNATTFVGTLTGNASTATALATARAINGVNFDGTSAITVAAAAGTLTGTTLNSTVVTSSLTSVGTLNSVTVAGTINQDMTSAQYQLVMNSSNANGRNGQLVIRTASTHYAWMISAQQNVNEGFEITPSTTQGGTTFSNPALQIDGSTSNVKLAGNLTTAAPNGGTAAAWKFGVLVTTVSLVPSAVNYLQVDVGGTLYKVALDQ